MTSAVQTESKFKLTSGKMRARLRELALLPVIVIALIVGAVSNSQFLTANNLINNILVTSAVLGIVVVGQALVLITGQFDLSQESVVGLLPMLAVWLVVPAVSGGSGLELSPWLAIGVLIVGAIVIGLINGTIVAGFGLNAFIVTLAMLILLRGLTLAISGGKTLSGLPDVFLFLGSARPLGVPIQVWIFALVVVLVALFMRLHPTGRRLYAIGGNPAAASAAGINVRRLTIGVFVAGSLLAALAGLLLTGRIASVAASQGDGMIFTVFASAVIGGISLNGGRGTILGATLGVLLLGVIQNILTLSAVPSYWIEAIYGLIILIALLVNHFTNRQGRGA